MAKTYTPLNATFSQHVTNFNKLVTLVGDLDNLNPTLDDSSLVSAINTSILQSGTDSASVLGILDSGGYIGFTIASSEDDIVLKSVDGTIDGQKTFTSPISVSFASPIDVYDKFRIRNDATSTNMEWVDSVGATISPIVEIQSSSIGFYTDGILVASIDNDSNQSNLSLMTREKSDIRYIKDSASVDQTRLKDVVSLIIYDSNGTPVKTLYGAGS